MKNIIIAGFVLVIGLGIGLSINFSGTKIDAESQCAGSYVFINRQLDCFQKAVISKKEYSSLVEKINSYIELQKKEEKTTLVGIYFRDLNQGPTFGINRDSRFIPASLLKLPLLMGLYSAAETDSGILKEFVEYHPVETKVVQTLIDIPPLEEGEEYSVDELIGRMIVYSDNSAFDTLQVWIDSKFPDNDFFVNTLTELGLAYPRSPTESTFTVKSYSSLFRQLYNSSYLTPEYSERVLEILSKSEYKEGLVAGVPETVRVAHKFGVRDSLVSEGVELHDCGIVYFPDNPYVLCVMTRGKELNHLEDVISSVSRMVYEEVNSRKQ